MRIKLFSLLLIALAGCQAHSESGSDISDIPATTPKEITRFDSTGEHFFSHLGYSTVVLNDGSVLIPDRIESKLYKVDSSGELLDIATTDGRGPGEVQDITYLSKSFYGEILLYADRNKKIILLDDAGDYKQEIIIPPFESLTLSEVYELNRQNYLMLFLSLENRIDPEKAEAFLVLFDREDEKYTSTKTISISPYVRTIRDGAVVGGRKVPFSAEDIRAYDSYSGHFYLYRSDKHEIVQIDHSLTDTLKTIPVNFQAESISREEISEIREDLNSQSWKAMQELLPETKALADDMMIDHQQNFWLKLNHAGEFQQWLIVSQEGELLQRVNLPKEAMLTHISEHHLGVRLDDVTFAFFEPVKM